MTSMSEEAFTMIPAFTLAAGEALVFVCVALGAVVLLPTIFVIVTYNRFQSIRQHLRESWADVDVELKRRYDLIPNLVNTVKGYAAHERETFERITALRQQAMGMAGASDKVAVEGEISRVLHKLIAVAEAYPTLKADRNFLELQQELAMTEDRIAAARRFYNANVRELNTLCSTFPSNVLAGMFSVKPEGFFELESAAERQAPTLR